ncbi:hypothetical protein DL546_006064 [Coniochaeta pulveracea]|uniref:Uncharacterized protein n=1 Tax=Coniochaeta pulveracea TaxID=177199 RepID=A0A420YFP6_9PEZI|nr:hypothetical protein DL546_006064 [Coniochaeta pulveracea]
MSSAPFNYNLSIISKEGVTFWYRPNPAAACSDGHTKANTASKLQLEFPAGQAAGDAVFYTAQLASLFATVTVSIGGVSTAGTWSDVPDGPVQVTLSRGGKTLATATGKSITSSCSLVNWNAWVGSAMSPDTSFSLPYVGSNMVCVRGTGANDFADMCAFSCSYGYCPIGACLCLAMGNQTKKPPYTGVTAYPVAGRSADFSGLCSFNCNLGKIGDKGCPSNICGTAPAPLVIPTVSPFLPPTCTKGKGPAGWEGLCDYSCNFGFCPSNICTCTQTGALNVPPPKIKDTVGSSLDPNFNDWGLCDFACPRGYCPEGSCNQRPKSGGGEPAPIDPTIWRNPDPTPTVGCSPPCNPLTTTLVQSWAWDKPGVTMATTVFFPAITTTQIPVFNINITQQAVNSVVFTVTPSLFCIAPITIAPPPGVTIPSRSPPLLTYSITSTPTPSTIPWPPITSGADAVMSAPATATTVTPMVVPVWSAAPTRGRDDDKHGGGLAVAAAAWAGAARREQVLHREEVAAAVVAATATQTTPGAPPEAPAWRKRCTAASIRPRLTFTSSNCPSRPAYTPVWGTYTGAVPSLGGPGWNVYTVTYGTYSSSTSKPSTSAAPSTTAAAPKPGVPLGGVCDDSWDCTGDACPKGQSALCFQDLGLGQTQHTCQCVNDKAEPPKGTMCEGLWDCNGLYRCRTGRTMVCETMDYSDGYKVCACV